MTRARKDNGADAARHEAARREDRRAHRVRLSPRRCSRTEAGVDVILVGDSVGNVVLGYENTLPVTIEEMVHHLRAVARARPARAR